MTKYEFPIAHRFLHFSELVIRNIVLVVCNNLPWLPFREVKSDFLAGFLHLMTAGELGHEPVLGRFGSFSRVVHILVEGGVGAGAKVEHWGVVEGTASEALVAGPRRLNVSGPTLEVTHFTGNVQNPCAFPLRRVIDIEGKVDALSGARPVLASSHAAGGPVAHQKCASVGGLLRLVVLDRHPIRKVDVDVTVHIFDQDVAVVVPVASHLLLHPESVGVLQVCVRSLVK